ncbi:hypothetical protein FrEUN1fDRAFT_4518 [Parafrankia sp. EUN1f]|nr:hypothetical protein FrEUN1fDRAFT_4518 [Parafrankia sp. EUN1f]
MTSTTHAYQLAEFVAGMRGGQQATGQPAAGALPAEVERDAVGRILDVVGNALAAQENTGPGEPYAAVARLAARWGGHGEASVLTGDAPLPAPSAAPSNHFTHPGIDCALALRQQGLRAEDVESAELGVAAAPLRTIGEPREEKARPAPPTTRSSPALHRRRGAGRRRRALAVTAAVRALPATPKVGRLLPGKI